MAFPAILNMLDLAGMPAAQRRAHGADAARHRGRHRRCTTPSRSPISSTSSVSARGRTSPSSSWSCYRQAQARGLDEAGIPPPRSAARRHLCPEPVRRELQPRRHRRGHHAAGRRTRCRDQAHRPRYGQVVLPDENHRPQHGDRAGSRDARAVPRAASAAAASVRRGTSTARCETAAPSCCARYGVESCDDSGYQEMTLSSLSTSDYPQLTGLCDTLEEFCEARTCEPVAAEPARRQLLHGADAAARPRAEDRSDVCTRGRDTAPARRHQQERHARRICSPPAAQPSPGATAP